MSKKKVTKSDLDKTLRELGFKEGDEINLPSGKSNANASTTDEGEGEGGEGDEENGNHPSKKGGN